MKLGPNKNQLNPTKLNGCHIEVTQSCLTYVHLSVLIYLKMYFHCVTWSRASHEFTGIYMFIPFFSLIKNTKTISNCNICLSTSFKAIMQKLLFFYLDTKASIPETWFTPIKGTSDLIKVSLLKYFIWSWLLLAMAQLFILL